MSNIIENIYQVFKDYYGEDKVDLQQVTPTIHCIIIHWPKVKITNEYDESVEITHFYGKVRIADTGKLCDNPTFIRAEYSELHWNSHYRHSHIHSLGNLEDVTRWQTSCLGSGPINHTIAKLKGITWTYRNDTTRGYNTYDYTAQEKYKDMMTWTLFAFELDKYVHVESVAGTPYYRMRDIGSNSHGSHSSQVEITLKTLNTTTLAYKKSFSEAFIKYLINSRKLKFCYRNNNFTFGMSNTEFAIFISNMFIEWYNNTPEIRKVASKRTLMRDFIKEVSLIDGELYTHVEDNNNLPPLKTVIGKELFDFKGHKVKLSASGVDNERPLNKVYIIDPNYIGYIAYKILRFINCKYGKSADTISQRDRIL